MQSDYENEGYEDQEKATRSPGFFVGAVLERSGFLPPIFQKNLHFFFTYHMIVGGGIPVTYAVPNHPRSVFSSFSSFATHF